MKRIITILISLIVLAMFWYLGDLSQQTKVIEGAVVKVLEEGYRTGDIRSEGCTLVGTKEMGNLVLERI